MGTHTDAGREGSLAGGGHGSVGGATPAGPGKKSTRRSAAKKGFPALPDGVTIPGVYRCTLFNNNDGYWTPTIVDGQQVAEDYVALSLSKARYHAYLTWQEYDPEITLLQVRAKSLKSVPAAWMKDGYEKRVTLANKMLAVVAKYGRHFFSSNSDSRHPEPNPFIAFFWVAPNGELWFIDSYTRKGVLLRLAHWEGFTHGGGMRRIVEMLAASIRTNETINLNYFAPNPGDYWGYGDDMVKVYEEVVELWNRRKETTH